MTVPILKPVARRPFAAATALAALLTAAAAWLWAHEGHQALPTKGVAVDAAKGSVVLSPGSREALALDTAEVSLGPLEERLLAPAAVVAPWQRHAFVSTRLGGKVAALYVRPGQEVARGQVLAAVESLELESLRLDLLDARNTARLSAENLERLRPLARQGAVPDKTLAEAESHRRQDQDALEIARRKLLGLGLTDDALDALLRDPEAAPLRSLPVLSPLAGTVTHVDVGVGKVVEPAEHLLEIVDLSRVWVRIGVLEKDLSRVRVGQPVAVHLTALADPAGGLPATVEVVGASLDPKTHWGTAWAELNNPDRRVLPGMVGRAEVCVSTGRQALQVPAAALVSDGAERSVLVEEGPGQYRRQNVVVERSGEATVVLAPGGGLFPRDRVVTLGSHELASFFVQGVLRPSPEAARNIGLRVEPAGPHPVAEALQLTGVVDLPPQHRAAVASPVAGTVARILVDRDQEVVAGEPVAEVASLGFEDWQLDLRRARLEADLLETTLRRARAAQEAVSERALREAESAALAARQRRDSLRRKLRTAGLSADQVEAVEGGRKFLTALPVRAPIAGTVVRFRAALGQAVKAEDPLFEVHDLTAAGVRAFVPEGQLAAVRVGQRGRMRLVADPGVAAEAVITRADPTLGAESHTASVWAELRGRPRAPLLDGMLARLTLVVAEPPPTLAVPRDAVYRDGTDAYLFVRRADGTFERRPVELGRADDLFVEVRGGVREAEPVAVEGVAGLQTAFASVR
jgi:RND family efflux transporter MFP subunit